MTNPSSHDQFTLSMKLINACKDQTSLEEFDDYLSRCAEFAGETLWEQTFDKLRDWQSFEAAWPKIYMVIEKTPLLSGQLFQDPENFWVFNDLLGCACDRGHVEAVEALLTNPKTKHMCNINPSDQTPLRNALAIGSVPVVKFLIESEKLEQHATFGPHAHHDDCLLAAVGNGQIEMTQYLLSIYPSHDTKGVAVMIDWNYKKMLDHLFGTLSDVQQTYTADKVESRHISVHDIPNIKAFIEKRTLASGVESLMDQKCTRSRKM